MIERYSHSEMASIWSEENKFHTWFEVELAVMKTQEELKIIPKGCSKEIEKKIKIDVSKIYELEKTLKHDVLAFTTMVANQVGPVSRFFHYGLTSNDVVDTALNLNIQRALNLILKELEILKKTLKKLAIKYKNLFCVGRTHGIHAEPTVFGLKFLSFYSECERVLNFIKIAKENIRYGKIAGAVGAYGVLTPQCEFLALKKLGLKVEPVATQIIPRDRHFLFLSSLVSAGNLIERIALEIRHLHRTEVDEVREKFTKGQKGSSAMPHKMNPIGSENLSGCARILRGYLVSVSENTALWHERDISHSSVERVVIPDATILLHYMIKRMNDILLGLWINEDKIKENLDLLDGKIFSGKLLLLAVNHGFTREEAYKIIQDVAIDSLQKNISFKEAIINNQKLLSKIPRKNLEECFNPSVHLKNVSAIYKRVLK
jgi:adenylosuccinate lyase